MNSQQALLKLQELMEIDDGESLVGSDNEEEDYEHDADNPFESDEDLSEDDETEVNSETLIESSIDRELDDINCTSGTGLKWNRLKIFESTKMRKKIKFYETPGL